MSIKYIVILIYYIENKLYCRYKIALNYYYKFVKYTMDTMKKELHYNLTSFTAL